MKARAAPEAAKEPPARQAPPREQAAGRYVELTRESRDAEKNQAFGKNTREAVEEKFGQAKEAKAAPMEKDNPLSKEELRPPPSAAHHAGWRGGSKPAPGGGLAQHSFNSGGPGGSREAREGGKAEQRDGKEQGDGKRLEFFEDRNPERGQDHGHGR